MSWELDYNHKEKCPCGKGYIITKGYSDDWGTDESYEYTNCKECYEKRKAYINSRSYAIGLALGKLSRTHIELVEDIEKI